MRGQTTLDFATGVSVFLLVILFVFTFIPGVLTPFTQTAQEETVTANRIANLVTKDIVAEPSKPYLLDGPCTAALLSDSSGSDCDFDGSDLRSRLDIDDQQSINITVRGTPEASSNELLCWDSTAQTVSTASDSDCPGSHVGLRAGKTPGNTTGSIVTARRIVSIEGTTATLEVSVW